VVVEQLALEADLLGARPRDEREPEVGVGQPARQELQLEQRLSEATGTDPRVPPVDRSM
jgi:hypothetical protein